MNSSSSPTPTHATNNFDFLRFLAAAMVIFSHSWALLGQKELTPWGMNWGSLGVSMFFVISGYLITASRLYSNPLKTYAIKRALRILPGLWLSVIVCVFVIGPLVTTLPLMDYFSARKTWSFLRNLLPYNMAYTLPGVFEHNPRPGINGVYWTLPIEIFCYLIVAVLGARLLRGRYMVALGLALLLLHTQTSLGGQGLTGKYGFYRTLYAGQFFLGSVLYLWRDKVSLKGEIFWAMLLCSGVALALGETLLLNLTLPYMVIYLAHAPMPFHHFGKYGDFSYGLYLYGFPIQQLLIMFFGAQTQPLLLFSMALAGALLCAIISWHAVESPALQRKNKWSAPLPA